MSAALISIIVPCYNGSGFISETLGSILAQAYKHFEIIVVDDGSTDKLKQRLDEFQDPRIKYVYQHNQGVSAARNNGLKQAAGEFVVYFDADDKMEEGFLEARLQKLLSDHSLSFVCGEVIKFNGENTSNEYFRGTTSNAIEEILLLNTDVTTCPSNYMYRKSFLVKNQLAYNTELSSTADKLFLIEASLKGKSELVKNKGKLLYRVSEQSMSHHFTLKLVNDNEKYFSILLDKKLIPAELKKWSLFLGNFMLSGAFWKVGQTAKALNYGWKAFMIKPVAFCRRIFQRS